MMCHCRNLVRNPCIGARNPRAVVPPRHDDEYFEKSLEVPR